MVVHDKGILSAHRLKISSKQGTTLGGLRLIQVFISIHDVFLFELSKVCFYQTQEVPVFRLHLPQVG
jgi:hypothetical protein